MTIYKDGGAGATQLSLDFFHHIKSKLGRIVGASASFEAIRTVPTEAGDLEYNLILIDDKGNEIWLSGCNCGYGGTGPHGTFAILKEVGLIPENVEFGDSIVPKAKGFTLGKE